MKKISIIGLGLMGQERFRAIEILQKRNFPVSILALHDPFSLEINNLAKKCQASVCLNIEEVIALQSDLVIVCAPHDVAVSITEKLLSVGQKVLLEKPCGRSLTEAQQIAQSCLSHGQLFVGQNYRFFPGVSALIQDILAGKFGKPIGLNMILGHGGKAEDKSSWKINKEKAGGGVLIDPGIHLIDLCRMVGGKLEFNGGTTWNGFWQTGIEEECRLLLTSENIPVLDLTVSLVRWRSTFRLEFYGDDGYGIVEGRGKSYGLQQYKRGRRWGWLSGKSQADSEELVLTSSCEEVFADELQALLFTENMHPVRHGCTREEALENMVVLELIRDKLGLS